MKRFFAFYRISRLGSVEGRHHPIRSFGIDSGLLKEAVIRCAQAAAIVGGRALLCHAIDEEAKAFYLKHGFQPSSVEPLTVMLGLKDILKLMAP